MQAARDYIRTHLARSLSTASPEDRLAAAWTAACGRAMAGHGSIVAYDPATSSVRIRVADPTWFQQMTALRSTLIRDLARISGLPVSDVHFELEKNLNTDSPRSAK